MTYIVAGTVRQNVWLIRFFKNLNKELIRQPTSTQTFFSFPKTFHVDMGSYVIQTLHWFPGKMGVFSNQDLHLKFKMYRTLLGTEVVMVLFNKYLFCVYGSVITCKKMENYFFGLPLLFWMSFKICMNLCLVRAILNCTTFVFLGRGF